MSRTCYKDIPVFQTLDKKHLETTSADCPLAVIITPIASSSFINVKSGSAFFTASSNEKMKQLYTRILLICQKNSSQDHCQTSNLKGGNIFICQ